MAPRVKLGQLCHVVTKGTTPTSIGFDFSEVGIPFLRVQNLNNRTVELDDVLYISEQTHKALSRSIIRPKDFLITIAGTIGRVAIVPDEFPESNCNQAIAILRFDYKKLNPQYLLHWLATNDALGQITGRKVTATISNLSLGQIKELEIPLPPLAEQQKIAAILDAADSLRQKDQQLVERYTALSQSLFLEMFGDPMTNPMGWKAVLLEEIGDIASGVTKGRKLTSDEVIDIPYMRVANVQDGYLDLNEIKYIPGSKLDLEKYILKNGDLLLTEGGDPDKLGRGAVWNGEIKNCIHQNHIFRVRLTSQSHIPIYLSKLCGSEYGKRYFIKSGKQTTGIASINKTQLRRFPVLCPPIALQTQFAERIQLIEAQKQQAVHSLEKSEALFNSLLQRAFTGELTAKLAA